jgi:hypothetical protein
MQTMYLQELTNLVKALIKALINPLNWLGLPDRWEQNNDNPEYKHEHKDHLTTLPTELLIKVFSQVPLRSYLDLCHL